MGSNKLMLIVKSIFEIIAFGLAVAAERRRSIAKRTTDPDQNYYYCVYDSDISTGFGVGALLILFVTQMVIMMASRCLCCGKSLNPGGSRAWAVVLFIFCWVTFIIAEACLLAGSVRNAYHTKYAPFYNDQPLSCEMLRKGVFGAGAAFIVFTSILTDFYYIAYSKAKGTFQPYGKDIGMGAYS